MYLGLPNYDSNSNRQYTFFSVIWVRSSHTARNLDAFTTGHLSNQDDKEDNDQLRLQKLKALQEKQLQAQQHIELYQTRISKAFEG